MQVVSFPILGKLRVRRMCVEVRVVVLFNDGLLAATAWHVRIGGTYL
jgi:hypothetical protein